MAEKRLGIIMHGVTGRMGTNQHLIRSILAIREQGGVVLSNGDRVMPDPILVGRNADKVARLADAHGLERWTTDLDKALADPDDTLFFDAASTQLRAELLKTAMDAGKAIYWFERTDMVKAHEVLGDVVALRGNLSPSMMTTGTPDGGRRRPHPRVCDSRWCLPQ